MKPTDNIEKSFEKLKASYRVPEGYFDQIRVPKQQPAKLIKMYRIKKYLVAAVLLLLVTLGYKVWHWQQNSRQLPQKQATELTNNQKIFDDLSDDEIIDYLSDEDIIDQSLDL